MWMLSTVSGRRGALMFVGAERQVWLRGGVQWEIRSQDTWNVDYALLTRGNETLSDAERLDDCCRIATFLFEFGNYLRSGHVDNIVAFRELVDLVEDHVVDIKPRIEDVIEDGGDEKIKVAHTACKKMNERGD